MLLQQQLLVDCVNAPRLAARRSRRIASSHVLARVLRMFLRVWRTRMCLVHMLVLGMCVPVSLIFGAVLLLWAVLPRRVRWLNRSLARPWFTHHQLYLGALPLRAPRAPTMRMHLVMLLQLLLLLHHRVMHRSLAIRIFHVHVWYPLQALCVQVIMFFVRIHLVAALPHAVAHAMMHVVPHAVLMLQHLLPPVWRSRLRMALSPWRALIRAHPLLLLLMMMLLFVPVLFVHLLPIAAACRIAHPLMLLQPKLTALLPLPLWARAHVFHRRFRRRPLIHVFVHLFLWRMEP